MTRPIILPALLAASLCGGLAIAQSVPSETAALALAKRQADEASRRSEMLERRAAAAIGEAARARATASALAARIEAAEADITAAEARIRIIEGHRAEQQVRLARRQQPLVHLTAALQTMSRRPPALALVQPGTVTDLVHVRSLLASTLPLIRARTAGLRAEVAESDRLRRQAEVAVASLAEGQRELNQQRTALAALETRQRRSSAALAQSALFESDKALAFTEEARDIGDEAGNRRYQQAVEQRLMALPGPLLRPTADSMPRPGQAQRGVYRLPVAGRLVRGMGELSDSGVHARGLTFETASGVEVVAPSGGRIVYAAPFRGYGAVVIIDHGGGWTTTITNLGSVAVTAGDSVAIGDPIGRTAAGLSRVSVELRRRGLPFPIAPLIGSG